MTLPSDLYRISDAERRPTAITVLSCTFQRTHGYEILDAHRVKFTLEQATKAQRGSRGIALFFL